MDKAKFEASQVFMYNVNRIWTILKDKPKICQLLSQKMNRGEDIDHQTQWKNSLNPSSKSPNGELPIITLSNKELITNSFFKQITYVMKSTATKMALQLKFVLYPNTLDNSTLTILEISPTREFDGGKEEDVNVNPNAINDLFNKDFAIDFLELFDEYLKQSPVFLNEYQSILISNSMKFVLECLLSARQIRGISNCSPHDYSGDGLKLIKCEKEKGRNQWFLIFSLYDKEYAQIITEISFTLLMINDQCTFLTFHHDFLSSIEQHQLNSLAKNKKEFLFDLKKYCEEHTSKIDYNHNNDHDQNHKQDTDQDHA